MRVSIGEQGVTHRATGAGPLCRYLQALRAADRAGTAGDSIGTAVATGQETPEVLVDVLAIAHERPSEDAFLFRSDLTQCGVAARVIDAGPRLNPGDP